MHIKGCTAQVDMKYWIETVAATARQTVLRLPPYHCQLNPTKLVWEDMNGYEASMNGRNKMADVEQLVQEAMTLQEAMTQITAQK